MNNNTLLKKAQKLYQIFKMEVIDRLMEGLGWPLGIGAIFAVISGFLSGLIS